MLKILPVLPFFGLLAIISSAVCAEPGFYPVNSKNIPVAVQQSADSVFEVYILDPIPLTTANISEQDEKGISIENNINNSVELTHQEKSILLLQIEYCRKQKYLKSCDIYSSMAAGSAFLLGDGQTLWTDYHVIDRFAERLDEKYKRPSGLAFLTLDIQNLPIFIFNSKKELVFSGSKADGRATVISKAKDHRGLRMPLDSTYRPSSDYVIINLSRPIGAALHLSKTMVKENEKVYAIGFPTGTGPFKNPKIEFKTPEALVTRAPYPDSTGVNQTISIGNKINMLDGLNRFGTSTGNGPITEKQLRELITQSKFQVLPDSIDFDQIFFSELDVVFGNSGGPIVNADGEVIGMAGSINPEVKDGKYIRTTTISTNIVEIAKKFGGK